MIQEGLGTEMLSKLKSQLSVLLITYISSNKFHS